MGFSLGGLLDDTLGFLDFGGSEGSPAQLVDPTPPEFVGLREPIAEGLRGFIGGEQKFLDSQQFQNIDQFTGQITSGETGALGGLGNFIDANPLQGVVQDQLQQTISGQFLSPDSNPFLQQTINAATRPLLEGFERITLPGLKSDFTRLGQVIRPGEPVGRASSPFNQAAAIAQGDVLSQVSDIASKIAGENFQQERGRQLQAVRDQGQLRTSEVNNLLQRLQAEALPRLIQEIGLDRALQQFNQFTQQLLQSLQVGGQLSTQPNQAFPAIPSTPGIFESGIRTAVNTFAGGAGTAGASFIPSKPPVT